MDFDGEAAAAKNGQQALIDTAMGFGKSAVAEINEKRETSTSGCFTHFQHSPKPLMNNHRFFYYLAQVGTAGEPKDDVLAGWYKRNLLIYGNLVRLIDSPGERSLWSSARAREAAQLPHRQISGWRTLCSIFLEWTASGPETDQPAHRAAAASTGPRSSRPPARAARCVAGKRVWGEPEDHDEAIAVLRRAVALGII